MHTSITLASVSVSDQQEIAWLPWSTCSYADSLAIFRLSVTDTIFAGSPASYLHPDELERAARYHRAIDRNRFMYGRQLLRLLLAHYTNQLASKVTFTIGKNRKPEITDNTNWHFNVSHSGDWVLVAIARSPVGVDVERLDPAFDFQLILPTSFDAAEQEYIQTAINPLGAFYRLWTRKEALAKATGKGLDDDFPNIPSLVGPHQLDSQLLGSTGNWLTQSFAVTNDYPAAVAYATELERPKFYTIDGGFFDHFTS